MLLFFSLYLFFSNQNSLSSCDSFSLNESIVHIFLTNIQSTQLIAAIYPPMYNPNTFCTDFEPMERSGSAIGDVNGDGILDTVDITTFITKVTSNNLSSFVAHSVLTRFSLNINKIQIQIVSNYPTDILNEKNFFPSNSLNNKDLYILPQQTWNAYLGRFGTSHYYRTISL
jgi:hypothetical protein